MSIPHRRHEYDGPRHQQSPLHPRDYARDELLDDALHFKTECDLTLYNRLKNDMDYYGIKRDEFVKSQNFSIAAEYLTKYKRAKTIFHRQLQTLSFKYGRT